jgi:hypothetical protein
MRHLTTGLITVLAATVLAGAAVASPPPGVPTPWNGPWGGGYLTSRPYLPWNSPYFSAGYGFDYSSAYYGMESPMPYVPGQGPPSPGVQWLPGGGYIVVPSGGY